MMFISSSLVDSSRSSSLDKRWLPEIEKTSSLVSIVLICILIPCVFSAK